MNLLVLEGSSRIKYLKTVDVETT